MLVCFYCEMMGLTEYIVGQLLPVQGYQKLPHCFDRALCVFSSSCS